jgi:hypothetical protein
LRCADFVALRYDFLVKRLLAVAVVTFVIAACGGATVSDIDDPDTDGGPASNTVDSGNNVDGSKTDSGTPVDSGNTGVDSSQPIVDSSTPDTGPQGTACTVDGQGVSTDCPTGYACIAPNCATGTCTKVPATSGDYVPVCGCDTINYWNASTASQKFYAGIKGSGKCTNAMQCTGASPNAECGPIGTTTCEFVGTVAGGTVCVNPASGSCWGLPDTCATTTTGVEECVSAASCTTLCDAITNQTAYRPSTTCKAN